MASAIGRGALASRRNSHGPVRVIEWPGAGIEELRPSPAHPSHPPPPPSPHPHPAQHGTGHRRRWWSRRPFGGTHSPRARRQCPHARQATVSVQLLLVRGRSLSCETTAQRLRSSHTFVFTCTAYMHPGWAARESLAYKQLLLLPSPECSSFLYLSNVSPNADYCQCFSASWEATPPRQRLASTALALRPSRSSGSPTARRHFSTTPNAL